MTIYRLPAASYRGLGLLIGDSIVANAFADPTAKATLTSGNRRVFSQAVSGHTIAQQQTLWDANDLKGRDISWGVLQVGVNDGIAGTSSASMISQWTALADNLVTANPNTHWVFCPVLPARTFAGMTAGEWTNCEALNAAILAYTAPNVVICTSAFAAFNDGTGAMTSAGGLNSGVNLHPSSPGAGSQRLTVEWRVSIT